MFIDRFTMRCAIFVMLVNEEGKVLLQRRANTEFMNGYYDFVSGHLEDEESVVDTAVRETEEESGIKLDPSTLELVHVNMNYLENPYMNITFVAKGWKGEPIIGEPDKCDDAGFYSLENLPEKVTLNVKMLESNYLPGSVTYSKVDKQEFRELFGLEYSEVIRALG